ncbi:MAG: diguanylate cyclase [Myxococcales bacterium]|nr:diguanylate cyclase [Myxococcales bacterium]
MALNSVGKKLFWGIAVPALAVAVAGVGVYWRKADLAVRDAMREEASALAELVSITFTLTEHKNPETAIRGVHRAVQEAVRADARKLRYVKDLRIIDRHGVVRWSRRVEEEGKLHPGAARLLAMGPETVSTLEADSWTGTAGTEVVRRLGGMACAGCHMGETTMKVGVLQLTIDEPALRQNVMSVFLDALAGVLLLSAALAGATALSLRFFLTRPLGRLADAMRRAEEGDFLARAEVHSRDELGALAEAFNRMLARLTSMKAEEIDTHRDLALAHEQLSLKKALEESNTKLEGRLTELGTLYDVARSLTSTLELPELLSRITTIVPERLRIPKFSIMLVNSEGRLEVKSAHPKGKGTEGITFAIGEGACGRAAESHKPVQIADVAVETAEFKTRPGAGPRGKGALLSVPMVHGGALLGVLNFERPDTVGFDREEVDFLTTVADQAAMAVKNAQLHQTTVELSLTDPLTGVPNRRHLFSRLELEIARANRFGTQLSMLMVDIDHFKRLNDAAGHRAGDAVLREVCAVLKQMVRKVDTLARYGGEEFVLILPQVTKAEALEVAEKLRRAVEEAPNEHARFQPEGKITISLGVANLPVDAVEQDRLVDCADSALYASKRAGRNKATGYAAGMELHPGRERGPHAQKRVKTGELPQAASGPKSG